VTSNVARTWSHVRHRSSIEHPTGLIRETRPGGNAASPTARPGLDPGASLVTETNLSPIFFAQIQTHVDLDASPTPGQRPEFSQPVTDCDFRGVAAGGGLPIMTRFPGGSVGHIKSLRGTPSSATTSTVQGTVSPVPRTMHAPPCSGRSAPRGVVHGVAETTVSATPKTTQALRRIQLDHRLRRAASFRPFPVRGTGRGDGLRTSPDAGARTRSGQTRPVM